MKDVGDLLREGDPIAREVSRTRSVSEAGELLDVAAPLPDHPSATSGPGRPTEWPESPDVLELLNVCH